MRIPPRLLSAATIAIVSVIRSAMCIMLTVAPLSSLAALAIRTCALFLLFRLAVGFLVTELDFSVFFSRPPPAPLRFLLGFGEALGGGVCTFGAPLQLPDRLAVTPWE